MAKARVGRANRFSADSALPRLDQASRIVGPQLGGEAKGDRLVHRPAMRTAHAERRQQPRVMAALAQPCPQMRHAGSGGRERQQVLQRMVGPGLASAIRASGAAASTSPNPASARPYSSVRPDRRRGQHGDERLLEAAGQQMRMRRAQRFEFRHDAASGLLDPAAGVQD